MKPFTNQQVIEAFTKGVSCSNRKMKSKQNRLYLNDTLSAVYLREKYGTRGERK